MANLAERIRGGDAAAEEELVLRFRERVLVMVEARTRDHEVARDLTQETLWAVLCAVREGRLLEPERLAGYVCGTARNLVKNWFRSHDRDEQELDDQTASALSSPEEDCDLSERASQVRRAVAKLSRVDRQVLMLALVDELTPGEIAERLGLNPEAVRQRKARAIQRAREAVWKLSRS